MKLLLSYDLHEDGDFSAVDKALEGKRYYRQSGTKRLPNTTWWTEVADTTNVTVHAGEILALLKKVGGKPERVLVVKFTEFVLLP